MKPKPNPWMMLLTMISREPIIKVNPDICQSDTAMHDSPKKMRIRASILPVRRPASIIETRVPRPRGTVRKPESSTE
jgi:hypothetical protein